MAGFNPSQVAFNQGEWSSRLHGRVDAEGYRAALKTCTNMIPLPHGPARLRAGTKSAQAFTAPIRLLPFNVSASDAYLLQLSNQLLQIKNAAGTLQTFRANMVSNGTFDAGTTGWLLVTIPGGGTIPVWEPGGYVKMVGQTNKPAMFYDTGAWDGAAHTLLFRARGVGSMNVYWSRGGTQIQVTTINLTAQWQTFTSTCTPAAGGGGLACGVGFEIAAGSSGTWYTNIDDVFLYPTAGGTTFSVAAPWLSAELPRLQADQDLTKNRMLIVGGTGGPQLLTLNVHGFFELKAAPFITPPSSWLGSNWPTVIDWGYQGRLWLGATSDEPNAVWGSKSGLPFDFGVAGAPAVASDGWNFNASVRGALRWLQGQKTLLIGAERAEQVASGGGAVMWTANVNVEDESAHGSAAIQAAPLGDEVAFITRDAKELRALSFENVSKAGWVSSALSFVAHHLLLPGVAELHYAPHPDPMLVLVMADGSVACCVYDRSQKVLAWWRLDVGAPVRSAAVLDTTNGAELYLAVDRYNSPTAVEVEHMPLHEVGAQYLDSYTTGTVPAGGLTPANVLVHLAGATVGIVVDGQLQPSQVVPLTAPYQLALGADLEGLTYVIGRPYTGTLVQLPLEGGLQTGSSQSAKRRRTKVRLRLNNSALPLVNGKRASERAPADPMDTGTDLVTGDVDANVLGWDEDGALTITQDLPFRTEILAIFGGAQVNEV